MSGALDLAMQLADEQYAYTAAFRDIAVRFLAAVKRIGDPDLSCQVGDWDLSHGLISEAHALRAELTVVADSLRERAQNPDYAAAVAGNAAFLAPDLLAKLKATSSDRLDTSKLTKMCEELNDAYMRGNYVSSALLLRAIMNHIPPVFGASTFSEVVSQQGRSTKAILARLNDDARPIADLHTHILMRSKEHLPTKNQIEPYKAGFEVLIHEVLAKLGNDDA